MATCRSKAPRLPVGRGSRRNEAPLTKRERRQVEAFINETVHLCTCGNKDCACHRLKANP